MFFQSLFNFLKYLFTPFYERRIVFYAEDRFNFLYYKNLIESINKADPSKIRQISYIAVDEMDLKLKEDVPGLKVFIIKNEIIKTIFFATLSADKAIFTTPDLNTFHIKKSSLCKDYIYMFHSMVSTHMIYRKEAFKHFDTIFCVGDYQKEELIAAEKIYNWPVKRKIEYGYGRLEDFKALKSTRNYKSEKKKILIAPSWGPNGLIETGVARFLIEELLSEGMCVVLRPHPMTKKNNKKIVDEIVDSFKSNANFFYDEFIDSTESLLTAHILITDYSGVAFEFHYGYQLPVIFINSALKINNPDYTDLNIVPVEIGLRNSMGMLVELNALDQVKLIIRDEKYNKYSDKSNIVYNSEFNTNAAINYIYS